MRTPCWLVLAYYGYCTKDLANHLPAHPFLSVLNQSIDYLLRYLTYCPLSAVRHLKLCTKSFVCGYYIIQDILHTWLQGVTVFILCFYLMTLSTNTYIPWPIYLVLTKLNLYLRFVVSCLSKSGSNLSLAIELTLCCIDSICILVQFAKLPNRSIDLYLSPFNQCLL